MDSITRYAMLDQQKDLINYLIRNLLDGLTEEDYKSLTESVVEKIGLQNEVYKELKVTFKEAISTVAEEYEVEEDTVLEYFLYFMLIIENTMLTKSLEYYVSKIKE